MTQPCNVVHFAIECDDVERARAFYEAVFGWSCVPWGPPDYFQIVTGSAGRPGILGDLRGRSAPLGGSGHNGYVCTIGVADLSATLAAVMAHGGQLVHPPFRIEHVGDLARIADSEGNHVMLMEHVADLVLPEGVRL